MITLSIGGSGIPQRKNAALLSPCHIQISPPDCSFLRQSRIELTRYSGHTGVEIAKHVLDLFSLGAMFEP
jgi:hypothetical protein